MGAASLPRHGPQCWLWRWKPSRQAWLPSLVVSSAENQRPTCEALAAEHRIAYLGHRDEVTVDFLGRKIKQLMSDAAALEGPRIFRGVLECLCDRGRRLVDGQGVARAILALQSHAGSIP